MIERLNNAEPASESEVALSRRGRNLADLSRGLGRIARLRYPAAVAAIRTEITLDRYRLLKTVR